MTTIDPEDERRRLQDFYAGQNDGELENVARESDELTDIAREALRAELAKRDLYAGELDAQPQGEQAEFRDLVTIRSFWNLLEAELAKGLLDSAGIETFLFDQNMVRMDWF